MRTALQQSLLSRGYVRHAGPGEVWHLKSGAVSTVYVDMRELSLEPELLGHAARALLDAIPAALQYDYVAGLPLGGIPLAVALGLQHRRGVLLLRKTPKAHGTGRVVEATLTARARVLLVDDVITSGSTVRETLELLADEPVDVVGLACLVNRTESASPVVPGTAVPVFHVFTLNDLLQTPPPEVPQLSPGAVADLLDSMPPVPGATEASNWAAFFANRQPGLPKGLVARAAQTENLYARALWASAFLKHSNLCFSADHPDPARCANAIVAVAPHVAAIKLHDQVYDPDALRYVIVPALRSVAHSTFIISDRKLADIANTCALQLARHPLRGLMHLCTVHTVAGPGVLGVLGDRCLNALLIAEMSSEDSGASVARACEFARAHPTSVCGFVCQDRNRCDAGDGLVYMTPGVRADADQDHLDQRYRSCRHAILAQRNDFVIVGRGIYETPDPARSAATYRERAWNALLERFNVNPRGSAHASAE